MSLEGRVETANSDPPSGGSLYNSIMSPRSASRVAAVNDGEPPPPGSNTVNPVGNDTTVQGGARVVRDGYAVPGANVQTDDSAPGTRETPNLFNWVPDYEYKTEAGQRFYQAFQQRKDLPIELDSQGLYHVEYGDVLGSVASRNLRAHNQPVNRDSLEAEQAKIIELNKARYPELDFNNPKWHHKGEFIRDGWRLILPGSETPQAPPRVVQRDPDAPPRVIPRRDAPIVQQDYPDGYRDVPPRVVQRGGTTYDIDAPTVNIYNGGAPDQYSRNVIPRDYQVLPPNGPVIIQNEMPPIYNNSLYSRRFVQTMPWVDPRMMYMNQNPALNFMMRFGNRGFGDGDGDGWRHHHYDRRYMMMQNSNYIPQSWYGPQQSSWYGPQQSSWYGPQQSGWYQPRWAQPGVSLSFRF